MARRRTRLNGAEGDTEHGTTRAKRTASQDSPPRDIVLRGAQPSTGYQAQKGRPRSNVRHTAKSHGISASRSANLNAPVQVAPTIRQTGLPGYSHRAASPEVRWLYVFEAAYEDGFP